MQFYFQGDRAISCRDAIDRFEQEHACSASACIVAFLQRIGPKKASEFTRVSGRATLVFAKSAEMQLPSSQLPRSFLRANSTRYHLD